MDAGNRPRISVRPVLCHTHVKLLEETRGRRDEHLVNASLAVSQPKISALKNYRRRVEARPLGLDDARFFLRAADMVDCLTLTRGEGTGRLAPCKGVTRAQYLAGQAFGLGAPGASFAASAWPCEPRCFEIPPQQTE